MRTSQKPALGLPEGLLLILAALLLVDHYARLPPIWHHVFLLAIVAVFYATLFVWLRIDRQV